MGNNSQKRSKSICDYGPSCEFEETLLQEKLHHKQTQRNLNKAIKLSKYLLKEIDQIEAVKSELAERMIKDIDQQHQTLN